jgi:hypothetical protein
MKTIPACTSSKKMFQLTKSEEFASQPLQAEKLLSEMEAAHLPNCVKKYLAYTGAIARSKPQNVCIEFDAQMFRKPGDKPMKSQSVQYNFYGEYTRLFLMKAGKMGIPFRAMHIYKEFAPGSLIDNRLTWSELDSLSAKVTLTNGKYTVSAILFFNEAGELINFVSDDRSALQDDGTIKQVRWTTPVSEYKEFEGRKIPTVGKTIWHYPEGDFTYGVFHLRSIKYNVAQ